VTYDYPDAVRPDILRMIPADGLVIGSVGCGRGATEALLVAQGREVHGVDVAPEAIEQAMHRITSPRVVDPGERAPFAPASLDGLILADVLEHLTGAGEALASFAAAVKPGGWIAISVPNMRNAEVIARFVISGDWPEETTGIFDRTHVQIMSRKRLERWCLAAGLRPESWFDCYDPNGPRRHRFFRTLDRLTFRCFHHLLMYELQVLCRR